jgi:hypothetical protein
MLIGRNLVYHSNPGSVEGVEEVDVHTAEFDSNLAVVVVVGHIGFAHMIVVHTQLDYHRILLLGYIDPLLGTDHRIEVLDVEVVDKKVLDILHDKPELGIPNQEVVHRNVVEVVHSFVVDSYLVDMMEYRSSKKGVGWSENRQLLSKH